jgi:hypothetical protein
MPLHRFFPLEARRKDDARRSWRLEQPLPRSVPVQHRNEVIASANLEMVGEPGSRRASYFFILSADLSKQVWDQQLAIVGKTEPIEPESAIQPEQFRRLIAIELREAAAFPQRADRT